MTDAEKVVRKFYEALSRYDVPAILELCDPATEWRLVGPPTVPYLGSYRGTSEVRTFFERLAVCERLDWCVPRKFLSSSTEVAVLGEESGMALTTRKPFKVEWMHWFAVKEGRIASFLEVIDSASLQAAYL